jgi:hypothetical protein
MTDCRKTKYFDVSREREASDEKRNNELISLKNPAQNAGFAIKTNYFLACFTACASRLTISYTLNIQP